MKMKKKNESSVDFIAHEIFSSIQLRLILFSVFLDIDFLH